MVVIIHVQHNIIKLFLIFDVRNILSGIIVLSDMAEGVGNRHNEGERSWVGWSMLASLVIHVCLGMIIVFCFPARDLNAVIIRLAGEESKARMLPVRAAVVFGGNGLAGRIWVEEDIPDDDQNQFNEVFSEKRVILPKVQPKKVESVEVLSEERQHEPVVLNEHLSANAAVSPGRSDISDRMEGAAGGDGAGAGDMGGPGSGVQGESAGMGNGSGQTVGEGEPAVSEADLWKAYSVEISKILKNKKFYPPAAKKLHQEGVVIVGMTVLRDGTITGIRVLDSSGYSILDLAAIQAVELVGKLPAFPEGISIDKRTIRVPYRYQLK